MIDFKVGDIVIVDINSRAFQLPKSKKFLLQNKPYTIAKYEKFTGALTEQDIHNYGIYVVATEELKDYIFYASTFKFYTPPIQDNEFVQVLRDRSRILEI